jgi:hypothetical protein
MAGVLREMEASNKFPQDTIDKIRSNLQWVCFWLINNS